MFVFGDGTKIPDDPVTSLNDQNTFILKLNF